MQSKSNPFATDLTYTRDAVIEQLSRIRWPEKNKRINPVTLWRWCNLAQVGKGLSAFDLEQCGRLARVAHWKRQGLADKEIIYRLETITHDSAQARNQDRSKAPESSQQWGGSSIDDIAAQFR